MRNKIVKMCLSIFVLHCYCYALPVVLFKLYAFLKILLFYLNNFYCFIAVRKTALNVRRPNKNYGKIFE